MRFVHAADLHLDSPLTGLSPYEGAPLEDVRGATRRALAGLVDLCLEEEAQLLLLAGDLYDGDWKDYATGLYFLQQMGRLLESGTRVVWIRGNHDAASRITRFLEAPTHVHELSTKVAETLTFEDLGVAVHGMGYASRDVTENLAEHYPPARPGLLNVGLLHTAVDGRPGHANYAPCKLGDLIGHGYDYWALGHIHQREVLSRDPWVVFPGNLQGRHIGETGPKGATLVDATGGRIVNVQHRDLDVVRWERVVVDVSPFGHLDDVLDGMIQGLSSARKAAGERTLAVRVELRGRSALHSELQRDQERLLAQLRLEAHSLGSIYLEDLRLHVRPGIDLEVIRGREDALGGLFSQVRERIECENEAPSQLTEDLFSALPGVPTELKRHLQSTTREIFEDAEQLLLARLLEGGEGE